MALRAIPLTLKQANDLVAQWHRHHKHVQGHRFSIGAVDTKTGNIVGAVVVGRPVARQIDYNKVAEVTRLVTNGFKNAPSFLYSRAAHVANAMGFDKIQTYILELEPGITLKASGWTFEGMTSGGDWNRQSRSGRRRDQPQCPKQRWIKWFSQPKLEIDVKSDVT